jgi:hypothetical protein
LKFKPPLALMFVGFIPSAVCGGFFIPGRDPATNCQLRAGIELSGEDPPDAAQGNRADKRLHFQVLREEEFDGASAGKRRRKAPSPSRLMPE